MKKKLVLSAFALAVFVQSSVAQQGIPPDEVVVNINDVDYTMGHIDRIRNSLPEAFRQQTLHMNNKAFIDTFAYLHTLAALADEEKLLEQEPYKSQFAFNRTNYLAQTYLQTINRKVQITEEDKQAYLERHRAEYEEARVSAIYVDFSPVPELTQKAGKEVVTESDAWQKAEGLINELRQGADFAALAREHSDDESSAQNGGDLGFFRQDDSSISDAVKQAIFALQGGQISRAVKDGARFYVFKVTERRALPKTEIEAKILQSVHSEKLRQRMDDIRAGMKIEFKNEAFENGMPAPR